MNPVEFGGDCVLNLLVPLGERCYIHDSALRSVFFRGGGGWFVSTRPVKSLDVFLKRHCAPVHLVSLCICSLLLRMRRRKHFLWFLNNPAASLPLRFHSPWKIVKRKKGVKTLAPVRWFPFQPVIACVSIPNPVFLARRPLSSKLMAFTPEVKVSPRTPHHPSPT